MAGFDGSGNFNRPYSWTADAAAGNPISATKFDTDGTTVQSAFNICLTRDGQGVPSQALAWGWPLSLTKGSDGTVLTLARSGGTNNPSAAFSVTDSGGLFKVNITGTTASFALQTASAAGVTLSNAGNWAFLAPSSGTAVSITGVTSTNQVSMTDGTVTTVVSMGSSQSQFGTSSNHPLSFQSNNTVRMTVAAAGNVTINAPSSGATLALAGNTTSTSNVLSWTGNTTGGAYGRATNTGGDLLWGIENSVGTGLVGASLGAYSAAFGSIGATSVVLFSNSSPRVSVNSTGNVTINAPSSGIPLTVNGITANSALAILSSGAGNSLNVGWNVGISGAAWNIYAAGTDPFVVGTTGASIFNLATNSLIRLSVATTGNVTINAPSSGAALVVNGSASTPANSIGNSSTAFTLDCSKSNVHYVTMNGNVPAGSLTISNIQDGQTVNLYCTQDGTGTRTLGNPTGVKWPGGAPSPILSTPAGTVDCITFQRVNGVTYATVLKAFA